MLYCHFHPLLKIYISKQRNLHEALNKSLLAVYIFVRELYFYYYHQFLRLPRFLNLHSFFSAVFVFHEQLRLRKGWKKQKQPLARFHKNTVLKNLAIFKGKYLWWSLFLIKLRACRSATLLKRDSKTSVLLWILLNFHEHLFWRTSVNGCFWKWEHSENKLDSEIQPVIKIFSIKR